MIRLYLQALFDLVAPATCAGCEVPVGRHEGAFCALCAVSVEPLTRPWCPRCGRPGARDGPDLLCVDCYAHPPPFALARSAFAFGGELAHAIRRFKYGRALHLARPLAGLWAPSLRGLGAEADVIVPVPLAPDRLRRRGFNQVIELIQSVRRLGTPLPPLCRHVVRRRPGREPQARLSRSERRALPSGTFVCRAGSLRARRVLLVDDVITSGATARVVARSLIRDAGARTVLVASLARSG